MANKFTDNIVKNPNARDPQGQSFDKALWEKNQDKRVQDVQNNIKANDKKGQEQSKLKEEVSKMMGDVKAPDNSKERVPTHER